MDQFEQYLETALKDTVPSKVKDAMQYSLMNGGKRIRPRLLLAMMKAYGLQEADGYGAAAGIEMLHTYSLIHDDLPAMDDDTLRRGKPTCHIAYGEACAILAGDGLLTQAFQFAADASSDASINVKITKAFVDYAGASGMILGQIRDLEGEERELTSADELEQIHIYKTGKLLTLPLVCAAYLAHRDQDIPVLQEIGKTIGLSFQIQDDILDETSTVEELGKNIHSDIQNHKSTYVSLMGIEKASALADAYYEQAKELLHSLHVEEAYILALFEELAKRRS